MQMPTRCELVQRLFGGFCAMHGACCSSCLVGALNSQVCCIYLPFRGRAAPPPAMLRSTRRRLAMVWSLERSRLPTCPCRSSWVQPSPRLARCPRRPLCGHHPVSAAAVGLLL